MLCCAVQTDFSAVQFQAISYSLTQIDSGLVTLANQSQGEAPCPSFL